MFVFGSMNLYSQCKLERVKDDFGTGSAAYTKDVTLASVFPLVGSKKPWELVLKFMLVDGSVSLSVTHQSQTNSSSLSSIYFRFQDGTVLKMESPATTGRYNSGFVYRYTYTSFDLTKEDLMLFASKDLLKFQSSFVSFADYPLVEENIKSKNVEEIRKNASCILSEYNVANNTNSNNKKDIKENTAYECKYTKDEIDAFTKKRVVYTNNEILHDTKKDGKRIWMTVFGANIDGVNSIQLEWGIMANFDGDITEMQTLLRFDQLDLLLDNEKVLTLKDSGMPKFNNQSNYYISYKLFPVDDSTWSELKASPLKKLRLSFNNAVEATQDIDPKYTKSLMNVINCLDALGIPKSK